MLKRASTEARRGRATPGERLMGKLYPNSSYASNWSANRYEQVQHFLDWQFIAIRCIWNKIASITPNLAYVTDANEHRPGVTVKACDRALMNARGGGFGGSPFVSHGGHSFMTVGEYHSKALSVVKPHEELEPLESNHPLRRLVECPNPEDTLFDYTSELGMFLELCGSTYEWVIPSQTGKPCESWVIPAHWVWPRTGTGQQVDEEHPDANRLIQWYEIRPWGGTGSAGMLRLPPDEVVVTKYKNPMNKLDGYGNLLAISRWLDTEESITKSRWAQFINKARPELWIELGPQFEDPDDIQMERLYAKIANRHQGELNSGKPLITPAGSKAQVLSFSPNEMDYVQSETQLSENILSSWGVPKSAVGLVNDMTFGSILATLMQLCENCLNPRLAMIGQRRTKSLASRWDEETPAWSSRSYGGAASARRVKLWYDNTTPADPAQVNSDMQADFQCFALTPNEVRAMRGRRSYGIGGDNPIVTGPAGPMPLPINVEEKMDDLGELVAMYTEQAAGKKDAEKLGQQASNEDIPKDEVNETSSGEHNEGVPNLAEEEADDLADGGAVDKPNGKPSKSLVRKSDIALDSARERLSIAQQRYNAERQQPHRSKKDKEMFAKIVSELGAAERAYQEAYEASKTKHLRRKSSPCSICEGAGYLNADGTPNPKGEYDCIYCGGTGVRRSVKQGKKKLAFEVDSTKKSAKRDSWIGVDLDGTLAHYDDWEGADVIGEPVPAMTNRVRQWLAAGEDVRIFTARVADDPGDVARNAIEAWCDQHIGQVLPITNVKDQGMKELWDDRAVRVGKNTGERVKQFLPTLIDIASYAAQEAGELKSIRKSVNSAVVNLWKNPTKPSEIRAQVELLVAGMSIDDLKETLAAMGFDGYNGSTKKLRDMVVRQVVEHAASYYRNRPGGETANAAAGKKRLRGEIKSALPIVPRFTALVEKSEAQLREESRSEWSKLLEVTK